MFLALKEIKKEKLRSSLVIVMIVLISYLIFILTSLALGLARENTDALNSWGAERIAINSNANVDMRQSFITTAQAGKLSDAEALVGETSVVAKTGGVDKLSATFIGLRANQFIAQNLKLTSGHASHSASEVVVDTAFEQSGYRLGDKLTLNGSSTKYTIVGFTKNAKLNITPVVYGQLGVWRTLRGVTSGPIASAVVSKAKGYKAANSALTTYSLAAIIAKLPGYAAQNYTFELMIGFLMVISLIIIAVFLYILTMQKLPNYAVLRVQGIPSRVLVGATIAQSLLLVVGGLVIGSALTAATALAMPAAVPMAFDLPILGAVALGLVVMGLLGALIPVRSVLRVDPLRVIGG